MAHRVRPKLLVIDDQDGILRFCERMLEEEYDFVHLPDARSAEAFLENEAVEGVLLDMDFSQAEAGKRIGPPDDVRHEGLHILRWIRREHESLPVLIITGHRDQRAAVEAADLQTDYLVWEDVAEDPHILRARLHRVLARSSEAMGRIIGAFHSCGVLGESSRFVDALSSLHRALRGEGPILLLGETGTGKDLLAAAVHALSGVPERPFVSVNVASLSPTLIESELFGHARGAFTGAERSRVGKLRLADGGTLFLNEIADLPLESQSKLLSCLERCEVVPVGEDVPYPARFRLVAATSIDLRAATGRGAFRKDLYYRLAWNTIEIPALRERADDIPLLAREFLRRTASYGSGVTSMTPEAIEYLGSLPWEGNVRQLRAVVEASAFHADYVITLKDVREVVEQQDFRLGIGERSGTAELDSPGSSSPRRTGAEVFVNRTFRELTELYFRWLLVETGDNLPEVARRAGIARATAYNWKKMFDEKQKGPGRKHPPRREAD